MLVPLQVTDYDVDLLGKKERNLKYSFVLAITDKSGEPKHIFATKSQLAKTKWIAELNRALTVDIEEDEARTAPPPTSPRPSSVAAAAAAADAAPPVAPRPSVVPPPPPVALRAEWEESSWFVGKLDRSALEGLFANTPNGAFLVRESKTRPGQYSLSVMFDGKAKHIMISREDRRYFITKTEKEEGFETIQLMVNYFRYTSLEPSFHTLMTPLVHPIRTIKKGAM